MPIGGVLTVESDQALIVQQLPDEGSGFLKQVFSGSFEFSNSGGCRNFGTYDKNPAYCIRVRQNHTRFFFRMMLTSEVAPDGQTLIKDPERFQHSIAGHLYRLGSNAFPVSANSLNFNAMKDSI